MASALIATLVMVGIAAIIGGFIRYKIWGAANRPTTIVEYGRSWAAYIAFIVPMASISNFIHQSFAEGLARFFVLIIFYPFIAFVLGCFYGLFKLKSGSQIDNDEHSSSPSVTISNKSSEQTINPTTIRNKVTIPSQKFLVEELYASDEWDLAFKYDDNLKNDFSSLSELDVDLAKDFRNEVIEKELFLNYKDLLSEYMKKALGVSEHNIEYSSNKLINNIASLLVADSPTATKEFLQLIRLYKLEEIEDSNVLAGKIMPLLQKIEKNNGIQIANKVNFDMPNDSLIKFGMYKELVSDGYKVLQLANGCHVAVTQTEYRVYDSEDSALSAIGLASRGGLWTLRGLVEKYPSGFMSFDAKCPSCQAPIRAAAESCYRCNAVFDSTAEWKPVKN